MGGQFAAAMGNRVAVTAEGPLARVDFAYTMPG